MLRPYRPGRRTHESEARCSGDPLHWVERPFNHGTGRRHGDSGVSQETYVDARFIVAARGDRASEGVYSDEIEANAFAAELLMPENWLRSSLKEPLDEFDDDEIKRLAKDYKVSAQAMTFRLTNLNLFMG